MKKMILTVLVIAGLLTQTACTSNAAKKAIEESKLSMAKSDYSSALNLLNLARSEGSDSSEIDEMILIIESYITAKDEFEKANMDGAEAALKNIPDSYKKYTIASDIETLKQETEAKKTEMGNIDSQIAAVKKWIAEGDYDSASANISEIYSKNITDNQRSQVDELRSTIESAKSKIDEASNKKPDVVYVPQNLSSNTNVVATYYVVNCKKSITLRSAPSTSASEITQIPLGQAVGYIENAGNGFYKINYDGAVGYGLASYLSSTPTQENQMGNIAQVVNAQEFITLRSAPSTSAQEVTKIPAGAYVTYLGTASNGFYMIEYNGMRGYGLQSYLQIK